VLEGWVVLAQLVVGPAPDPDADPDEVPVNWEYVPSNDTLALSTTVKAGGFQIVDEPPPPDPPIIRDFRTVLGPFLFSAATDPSGVTYLDLAHPGLVKGQKVRLNILGILEPHPEAEGETMQFRGSSLATYQVAPTPTDNRGLAITF
jgi:hypothetical protein